MKKVLIISPYFPPSNSADMQRVRMSLPYFEQFGWQPEIVMVNPNKSDIVIDNLLKESIPKHIKIHAVEAFSKKWTGKFGLGSLSLRSLWYYKKYVNQLLKKEQFDLIYFSTTEFSICILGAYWKTKFNTPFVIDIQDPWHSDYYQDKPKAERPKKYWFSYRLNKFLEPIAMKQVDGIISVSSAYIETLKQRYDNVKQIPCEVITFGAFEKDFEIAEKYKSKINTSLINKANSFNFVYVGRGGYDMQKAISLLFEAFKQSLEANKNLYKNIHFYFIGTSYAPVGTGAQTIMPLALKLGISAYVTEQTDRVSFYQAISYLSKANALFIPGSDDPAYTASKIYPYILAKKPILAIFNIKSSASKILAESKAGVVADLNDPQRAIELIESFLKANLSSTNQSIKTDWSYFKQFNAQAMTKKQCKLFNQVLDERF